MKMFLVLLLVVAVVDITLTECFTSPLMLLQRSKSQLYLSIVEQPIIKSNLKVPSSSWKWPPIWPFPKDFLEKTSELNITSLSDTFDPIVNDEFQLHFLKFCKSTDSLLVLGTKKNQDSLELFKNYNITFLDFESFTNENELDFQTESFDKFILLNGVEYLYEPRDLFRELWRVLKPTGLGFIGFSSKPSFVDEKAFPIKMWLTMNDEQKIWIAGSYFHYSATAGWEKIEGYDLFSSTGEEKLKFDKPQEGRAAYVVQSSKIFVPQIDLIFENKNNITIIAPFLETRMLGLKNLEIDDRKYTSLRIASLINKSTSVEEVQFYLNLIPKLSSIYKVLKGFYYNLTSS
jgi:SAM-dependent methyltransferase